MKLKFKKVGYEYVATIPTKVGMYEVQIWTNFDRKFGWQIHLDGFYLDSDYGYRKKDCVLAATDTLQAIINRWNLKQG
jgi:hypothetical protein